jgi:pyruvate formate lyase activating enzyme
MNMEDEEIIEIAKLALELKINEIHLMPFHQMGKDKYRYLGRNYSLSEKKDLRLLPCGKQVIQKVENLLVQKGINVFIGG